MRDIEVCPALLTTSNQGQTHQQRGGLTSEDTIMRGIFFAQKVSFLITCVFYYYLFWFVFWGFWGGGWVCVFLLPTNVGQASGEKILKSPNF